jgi:flagellar assembly protein FliH
MGHSSSLMQNKLTKHYLERSWEEVAEEPQRNRSRWRLGVPRVLGWARDWLAPWPWTRPERTMIAALASARRAGITTRGPAPVTNTSPALPEQQAQAADIHAPLPGTGLPDAAQGAPQWLQAHQQAGQQTRPSAEDSTAPTWPGLAAVTGTVRQQPRVLRGEQANGARRARVTADLRGAKPTMIDPEILEQARQSAAAAGYADGWTQGQREAQAQVYAQAQAAAQQFDQTKAEYAQALQHALARLAQAADELERRMAQPMTEVENELITTSVELTQILLGHQLRWPIDAAQAAYEAGLEPPQGLDDPYTQLGLDAIGRALALAPAKRAVTLRLHPEQAQVIEDTLARHPQALGAAALDRTITILADPSLGLTDCVADCDATRIDAQLPAALARVRGLLAGPGTAGAAGAAQGGAHDE